MRNKMLKTKCQEIGYLICIYYLKKISKTIGLDILGYVKREKHAGFSCVFTWVKEAIVAESIESCKTSTYLIIKKTKCVMCKKHKHKQTNISKLF